MVSHKNYKLNEDFVNFLTSKLITWFIDSFTFKIKSQSIDYLLTRSALNNVICGIMAFKKQG